MPNNTAEEAAKELAERARAYSEKYHLQEFSRHAAYYGYIRGAQEQMSVYLHASKREVEMTKVSRVEVIDYTKELARDYVKYLPEGYEVVTSLQDDGRTLKVFIQKTTQ